MKKLTWILVLVLATGLIAQEAAKQEPAKPETPQQDVAKPAEQAPADAKAGKALLYIYRYKQFAGSGLEPSVFCDEMQLARMDNGRYFIVELEPGAHTFRSNDKQSGIELKVEAGKTYYVRVEIVAGFMKGHGRLVLMQPEQGAFEIKKLQYIGMDKIKEKKMVLSGPPMT